VCEQQVVELQVGFGDPPDRLLHRAPLRLRVVAEQLVGREAELTLVAKEAVAEQQRSVAGRDVQRRVVGGDRAHLHGADAGGELLPELERLDLDGEVLEAVQTGPVTHHGAAELLAQALDAATVESDAQHDPGGRAATADPPELGVVDQRIDQRRPAGAQRVDVVTAHALPDRLVEGHPVEDAGKELPHQADSSRAFNRRPKLKLSIA
jgi:hypothetical protein